jgi:hypothetical protein
MQPSLITYHLTATRVDALRRRVDQTRRVIKTPKRATA